MFEPEYTNAMASVLEMIDKYGSFVLPEEEISDKMFEFLKRERSKSEEVMDSSDIDVCTSRKTRITPCFTYEDTDTYEGEGETEDNIRANLWQGRLTEFERAGQFLPKDLDVRSHRMAIN